jgi:hypothetical protein
LSKWRKGVRDGLLRGRARPVPETMPRVETGVRVHFLLKTPTISVGKSARIYTQTSDPPWYTCTVRAFEWREHAVILDSFT